MALLVDPTVTNIFGPSAPMQKQMNYAPKIYRSVAVLAGLGAIRPISALMPYISGEAKKALQQMPKAFVGQVFTKDHLMNMSREFLGMKAACQQLEEQQHKTTTASSPTPLILLSACAFDRLYGGQTKEQTRQWWKSSQAEYTRSSSNAITVEREQTHVELCNDGQLQGQYLQKLLEMIRLQSAA